MFEEMKELEETKSKETLLHVQKKAHFVEISETRDEARRLQRSGSSRRTRKEADTQDFISF